MNKREFSDAQELDEQLAAFTDRVLSEDEIVEMMEDSTQQDEFIKLQKAVLRMKSATRQAYPGKETQERIRGHVMAEWKADSKPKVISIKERFQLWKFSTSTLAGGFAFILLFGFLLFFGPLYGDVPLGATAGDGPVSMIPFLFFMGITLVVIILWFRRKR
jgi:hypothetical protein